MRTWLFIELPSATAPNKITLFLRWGFARLRIYRGGYVVKMVDRGVK
jgi:hypothetical protein